MSRQEELWWVRRLRHLTGGRFTWIFALISLRDQIGVQQQVVTAPFFFVILIFMISLNHIGIATETGNSQLEKLFRLLGITRGISEQVAEQGVTVHFFNLAGEPPHLELLEVQDPQGTVSNFIKKRGPGIHHLSFLVSAGELDPLCEKLKKENFKFTYEAPKLGAQNMRINFIHPATAGGILIELMEPASNSSLARERN
jgi:methylmalonyl-CoA/ethylmalonyl-CoA epimerase